jgi:hypothetical protein
MPHVGVGVHVIDRRGDEERIGHGGSRIAAASPSPAHVLATVTAVAARLHAAGITWRLAGSAGQLLLGAPVRPGDVDVEVAGCDAIAAANALGLPIPGPTQGGGWSSHRSEGMVEGVTVDLSAGLEVRGPGGVLRADDAATVDAHFGSGVVQVVAPGESVARAVVAGDVAREQRARAQLPADAVAALAYAESRIAAAASAAR